ncbi:MAG: 4Fe-4S binding protein, partial [Deltaproteobacteria bacterium]|nr:4Fe-4S binding protein [Deltaproteobacteria bacterium]MBW2533965.1 4Fe-4S binding protein [Deltaproteobacteria bacterium]
VLVALLLVAGYLALRRLLRDHIGSVSESVHSRARYAKYLLLAVALVAAALGAAERVVAFDPLAVAFSGSYDGLTFALLGALLLLCLRFFRFWCRYFCPVGALLHLLNRVSVLGRLTRPKRYGRCDLGVRSSDDVDCIQCNRCLTALPRGAPRCAARPRPRLEQDDRSEPSAAAPAAEGALR